MKKIVVITTDGDSREDGNVYYSKYLIVESGSLAFNEPIFTDSDHGPCSDTDEDVELRMNQVVAELVALGYKVEVPEVDYIELAC